MPPPPRALSPSWCALAFERLFRAPFKRNVASIRSELPDPKACIEPACRIVGRDRTLHDLARPSAGLHQRPEDRTAETTVAVGRIEREINHPEGVGMFGQKQHTDANFGVA